MRRARLILLLALLAALSAWYALASADTSSDTATTDVTAAAEVPTPMVGSPTEPELDRTGRPLRIALTNRGETKIRNRTVSIIGETLDAPARSMAASIRPVSSA